MSEAAVGVRVGAIVGVQGMFALETGPLYAADGGSKILITPLLTKAESIIVKRFDEQLNKTEVRAVQS